MSVQTALDRALPAELADLFRQVAIGTSLYNLANPIEGEAVTVSANVGTLAYPPSHIIAVRSTAGSTKGHILIPAGETPNAGEVAVDMVAGTLTFAAADSVTAASVTYCKCPARALLAGSWAETR